MGLLVLLGVGGGIVILVSRNSGLPGTREVGEAGLELLILLLLLPKCAELTGVGHQAGLKTHS